jgi:hypothetical protein
VYGIGCSLCYSTNCVKPANSTFRTPLSIPRHNEPLGRPRNRPEPADRARSGSKPHILVDANDVPLSAIRTGANRNDVTQPLPLVDAIAPIRGVRGRPLRKPKVINADRGYDSETYRQRLR